MFVPNISLKRLMQKGGAVRLTNLDKKAPHTYFKTRFDVSIHGIDGLLFLWPFMGEQAKVSTQIIIESKKTFK